MTPCFIVWAVYTVCAGALAALSEATLKRDPWVWYAFPLVWLSGMCFIGAIIALVGLLFGEGCPL